MRKLAILVLSLMTGFSSFGPAQALPAAMVTVESGVSTVQPVQYRDYDRRYDRRDYDRRDRYSERRHSQDRYERRRHGDRYERHHRRNNAGAILGGLAAGAIIGGAIASQPGRGHAMPSQHIQWCMDRYRSYRPSDDTYVPRAGVRAYCNSPYAR